MKKYKQMLKRMATISLLGVFGALFSTAVIAEEDNGDDEQNMVASVTTSGSTMQFKSFTGEAMIVIVSGDNGYNLTLGDEHGDVSTPDGDNALPNGSYRYEVRSGDEKFSDKFSVVDGWVNY